MDKQPTLPKAKKQYILERVRKDTAGEHGNISTTSLDNTSVVSTGEVISPKTLTIRILPDTRPLKQLSDHTYATMSLKPKTKKSEQDVTTKVISSEYRRLVTGPQQRAVRKTKYEVMLKHQLDSKIKKAKLELVDKKLYPEGMNDQQFKQACYKIYLDMLVKKKFNTDAESKREN